MDDYVAKAKASMQGRTASPDTLLALAQAEDMRTALLVSLAMLYAVQGRPQASAEVTLKIEERLGIDG